MRILITLSLIALAGVLAFSDFTAAPAVVTTSTGMQNVQPPIQFDTVLTVGTVVIGLLVVVGFIRLIMRMQLQYLGWKFTRAQKTVKAGYGVKDIEVRIHF